ncbi:MAG TPA: hemerythrin domain-containing protein [Actinomadura sp.]|jgi:hemerythrin-like domain-containing protein|nr:hemerythrin domain-containing protein [Actinomadura sp.]
MAARERDLLSVLIDDHREIQDLLELLQVATEAQERRWLSTELIIEMVRHSFAEQMYLYPLVRQALPDGDAIVDQEIAEEAEVEKLLRWLERAEASSPQFSALATMLTSKVQRHIENEETAVFPRLADHVSPTELVKAGDRVTWAKAKARTRQRLARTDPDLHRLLAPGAGLVKRVRHLLTGRWARG